MVEFHWYCHLPLQLVMVIVVVVVVADVVVVTIVGAMTGETDLFYLLPQSSEVYTQTIAVVEVVIVVVVIEV